MGGSGSEYARRFGRRLIAAMRESGTTTRRLSRATGLSESTISTYRCGKAVPSVEYAAKMARALGVTLDALAGSGRR